MNDDKKIKTKLAKYVAVAAAVGAVSESEAAIIYTDETPDFAGGSGSQYFLDLNNDGIDDFRIHATTAYTTSYGYTYGANLYLQPLAANNEALGTGTTNYAYPFALSSGAPISNGAGSWFNNSFSGGAMSLNYGSCGFGNWCNVTDGFIGLRFNIGGNTHYGWVRLDVGGSGNVWTVKDYAYEDIAGTPILAGDMVTIPNVTAVPAAAITGMDEDDTNSGDDLGFTLTASPDESTLSEYRVMAVKSADTSTFDLPTASIVAPSNYVAITPNGSPAYMQDFTSTMDINGDPIVNSQPYRLYVLNVADGTNANVDTLTQSGMDITLETIADSAINIVGTDIADNNGSTDLQASFNAAPSEAGIIEYRVIAVPAASAAAFDIAAANALPATAYVTVTPNGGPYSVNFAGNTDSDGNGITNGQPYTIFVHSVEDGVDASLGNINSSDSDVTLESTTTSLSDEVLEGVEVLHNNEQFILQLPTNGNGNEFDVEVYSAAGKLIFSQKLTGGNNTLDAATWSKGVYFINITSNGQSVSKKVIR